MSFLKRGLFCCLASPHSHRWLAALKLLEPSFCCRFRLRNLIVILENQNRGSFLSKNHFFIQHVDPNSSPFMVEMPGTAPGSITAISSGVYCHSLAAQLLYYLFWLPATDSCRVSKETIIALVLDYLLFLLYH